MLKNVGSADRNIRIGLGIAIIIVGVVLQSWWGLIGLLPLLTAGISFCPLYSVLGMSTSKK
jgi:type IV secretory pathway TrbD component